MVGAGYSLINVGVTLVSQAITCVLEGAYRQDSRQQSGHAQTTARRMVKSLARSGDTASLPRGPAAKSVLGACVHSHHGCQVVGSRTHHPANSAKSAVKGGEHISMWCCTCQDWGNDTGMVIAAPDIKLANMKISKSYRIQLEIVGGSGAHVAGRAKQVSILVSLQR
jgi:hypothetical protein